MFCQLCNHKQTLSTRHIHPQVLGLLCMHMCSVWGSIELKIRAPRNIIELLSFSFVECTQEPTSEQVSSATHPRRRIRTRAQSCWKPFRFSGTRHTLEREKDKNPRQITAKQGKGAQRQFKQVVNPASQPAKENTIYEENIEKEKKMCRTVTFIRDSLLFLLFSSSSVSYSVAPHVFDTQRL